ncbi:lipid-binding SYLF domain-containing protein [Amylibacter sp.]|nr:lipid-binding SYLF domain-containing protein [Amylibacter sp.]
MTGWSRRAFLASATAGGLSACAGGTNSRTRFTIDDKVSSAVQQMHSELPFTRGLMDSAAGVLVVPTVTKAGLIIGGSYGEGSLLIGEAPVDYYSVAAASYGLQAGGQQYSSALFFMDSEHLQKFRARAGWTLGADLEFTVLDDAKAAGIDNNTIDEAVYAVVFNQAGILIGISVEGSKYTRIIR